MIRIDPEIRDLAEVFAMIFDTEGGARANDALVRLILKVREQAGADAARYLWLRAHAQTAVQDYDGTCRHVVEIKDAAIDRERSKR